MGAYFCLAFKAVGDRDQGELHLWRQSELEAAGSPHGVDMQKHGCRASRGPGTHLCTPWCPDTPPGKPDLGTDHRRPLLGLAQIGSRGPKFSSQTPGVTGGGHMPLRHWAQEVSAPSRARLGLAPLPGRKVTEPLSDRQSCAIWTRAQKAGEQGL